MKLKKDWVDSEKIPGKWFQIKLVGCTFSMTNDAFLPTWSILAETPKKICVKVVHKIVIEDYEGQSASSYEKTSFVLDYFDIKKPIYVNIFIYLQQRRYIFLWNCFTKYLLEWVRCAPTSAADKPSITSGGTCWKNTQSFYFHVIIIRISKVPSQWNHPAEWHKKYILRTFSFSHKVNTIFKKRNHNKIVMQSDQILI